MLPHVILQVQGNMGKHTPLLISSGECIIIIYRGRNGNGDYTSVEEVLSIDVMWYAKAYIFINNVNKVLQCICRCPGFAVSIDEITKNTKGIPKLKNWMNNKPVKGEYKFWSICCIETSFFYKLILSVRFGNSNEYGNEVIDITLIIIE